MQILDSDNNLLAMLINLTTTVKERVFTDNTLDFQAALFNLKRERNKRHIHKKM